MITIDHDVPLPEVPKSGRPPIYPFASMQIGDSIALPVAESARVAAAGARWKRRHPGWNYTKRTNGAQVRLWRTA